MNTNSRGKIGKAQLSQSLLDEILNGSGGGSGEGTANITIKKFTKKITTNTSEVYIGTDFFAKETDELLVFKNSTYLEEGEDYIIKPNNTISKTNGQWIASTEEPDVFNFVCMMHIPQEEVRLHGSKLVDNSVEEAKLSQALKDKINSRRDISTYLTSIKDINMNNWSSIVNNDGLFTARITHSLKSESLIVSAIDKDLKRNVMVSYKILDTNSIEVEIEKKCNLKLIVINSEEAKLEEQVTVIDDNNISVDKTWSSEKIDTVLKKKEFRTVYLDDYCTRDDKGIIRNQDTKIQKLINDNENIIISGNVEIDSKIIISGVKNIKGSGSILFNTNGSIELEGNVNITDIVFDAKNNGNVTRQCVFIKNVININIFKCAFIYCTLKSLSHIENQFSLRIEHSSFTSYGNSSTSGMHCIHLDNEGDFNITFVKITDNRVDSDLPLLKIGKHCQNLMLSDNILQSSNSGIITTVPYIYLDTVYEAIISNNIFRVIRSNDNLLYINKSRNINIVNNNFKEIKGQDGIFCLECANININENQFDTTDASIALERAIDVQSSDNVSIKNNTISNSLSEGIRIIKYEGKIECRGVVITNNTLNYNNTKASQFCPQLSIRNVRTGLITNNYVHRVKLTDSEPDFGLTDSYDCFVTNNKFSQYMDNGRNTETHIVNNMVINSFVKESVATLEGK